MSRFATDPVVVVVTEPVDVRTHHVHPARHVCRGVATVTGTVDVGRDWDAGTRVVRVAVLLR